MTKILPASSFLESLNQLSKEQLIAIKGIGEVLADNFVQFLQSPRYQQLVNDFKVLEKENQGLNVIIKENKLGDLASENKKTICITGTFELPREQIKEKLEELGYKVVETVSSTTAILLAGDKSGSKLAKAQKLNLQIVTSLENILQS